MTSPERKSTNSQIVVIIGLIASVLTIFVFLSDIGSVSELYQRVSSMSLNTPEDEHMAASLEEIETKHCSTTKTEFLITDSAGKSWSIIPLNLWIGLRDSAGPGKQLVQMNFLILNASDEILKYQPPDVAIKFVDENNRINDATLAANQGFSIHNSYRGALIPPGFRASLTAWGEISNDFETLTIKFISNSGSTETCVDRSSMYLLGNSLYFDLPKDTMVSTNDVAAALPKTGDKVSITNDISVTLDDAHYNASEAQWEISIKIENNSNRHLTQWVSGWIELITQNEGIWGPELPNTGQQVGVDPSGVATWQFVVPVEYTEGWSLHHLGPGPTILLVAIHQSETDSPELAYSMFSLARYSCENEGMGPCIVVLD